MAEQIYTKCLKVATKINEDTMPTMQRNFDTFYKQSIEKLNEHSIKDAISQGRVLSRTSENKNVQNYINLAENYTGELTIAQGDALRRLEIMKEDFYSKSKNISSKNLNYIHTIKQGDTPAEILLKELVSFGKEIQAVSNEDIQHYTREINKQYESMQNYVSMIIQNIN